MKIKILVRLLILLFVSIALFSCKVESTGSWNRSKPTEPVLLLPNLFSNNQIEFSPSISPDSSKLYFVRSNADFTKFEIKEFDLVTMQLNNLDFSKNLKDFSPFVTADGMQLFFASFRDSVGKNLKDDSDIWYIPIKDINNNKPQKLDSGINTIYGEGFVSVSANGNLYFESNRPGGYGDWDIYMAVKTEQGYLNPVNLGSNINSLLKESDPFIAPDESYIIYTKYDDPNGFGSSDFYISFRQENNEFGKPINLGNKINTQFLEHNPHITFDGKYFFFSTDKPLNESDKYQIANFDIYYMSAGFIEDLATANWKH